MKKNIAGDCQKTHLNVKMSKARKVKPGILCRIAGCGGGTKVTHTLHKGEVLRRMRKCVICGARYITTEKFEQAIKSTKHA